MSAHIMAIFIFLFVGLIIGTWMLSGTIPMMICYGLKLLSPSMFPSMLFAQRYLPQFTP